MKKFYTLVMVASATLALAACGGSSDSTPAVTPEPTPIPTPTPDPITDPITDITPDDLSFTSSLYNTPSEMVISETITISGVSGDVPVTVLGGEYRINNGAWSDAAGTISEGDTLTLRLAAPDSYILRNNDDLPESNFSTMTVQVGNLNALFYVETGQKPDGDITPENTAFAPITDATPGTEAISPVLLLSGVDVDTLINVESGSIIVDGEDRGATTYASAGSEIQISLAIPEEYGVGYSTDIAYLIGDTFGLLDINTRDKLAETMTILPVNCDTALHVICSYPDNVEVVTWIDGGDTITGRYNVEANTPLILDNHDNETALNVSVIVDLTDVYTMLPPIIIESFVSLPMGEYDLLTNLHVPNNYFLGTPSCNTVDITLSGALGNQVTLGDTNFGEQNAVITSQGDLNNGQRTITVDYCDETSLYIEDRLYSAEKTDLQGSVIVALNGNESKDATFSPAVPYTVNALGLPMASAALNVSALSLTSSSNESISGNTVTLNASTLAPKAYSLYALSQDVSGSREETYKLFNVSMNVDITQSLDFDFDNARAALTTNVDAIVSSNALTYAMEGAVDAAFVQANFSYPQMADGVMQGVSHYVYFTPTVERFSDEAMVTVPRFDTSSLSDAAQGEVYLNVDTYAQSDNYDSLANYLNFIQQNSGVIYAEKGTKQAY